MNDKSSNSHSTRESGNPQSTDTARLLRLVEELTGYPVQVGTTDSAAGDAEMMSAAPAHPVHLVNVSRRNLRVADYIVALQCSMLLTMWSHPAGVPQFRLVTDKVAYAIRKASSWKGLARLPGSRAEQIGQTMVNGLLHQLLSTPSEMIAIEHCYNECPSLRQMQAEAVSASLRRNTETLKPEIKELAPPDIYEGNLAMCATLASLWCQLIGNDVAMIPYKSVGIEGRAAILLQKFRASSGTLGQRSVATVDAWAEELGLRSLYEWAFRPK